MKLHTKMLGFFAMFFMLTFSLVSCGGSSGGGGGGGGGAAPSINTSGGTGGLTGGFGGFGGNVDIVKLGGTGAVEVLSSGTVNAGFTPTAAAPDLGAAPVNITADKTIPLDPGFPGGDPGADEPYMLSSASGSLFISDGDGLPAPGDLDDVTATGLSVAAGATLTLELNSGGTTAEITFSNDVENNGTITTTDVDPTQRGNLELDFFSYHGASGSAIDTSGTVPGQNGGDIFLTTAGLVANAGFYNRGAINTAGADDAGGNGGNGGDVTIGAWEPFENSGAITSAGGVGGAGNGGDGGDVNIVSGVDYLYNSGAINSSGGNGTASGGQGGDVFMTSATVGDTGGELRNSGAVSATGGNGAAGDGGQGGDIELVAQSAGLLNNADLNSAGGDTSEATSGGGDSGDILVASGPSNVIAGPAGNLLLTGNLNSSGGNALAGGSGDGGWGGYVFVGVDASGSFTGVTGLPAPTTQRLALFSYGNIDTSGGSGNQGGDGGYVNVADVGESWDVGSSSFVDDVGGDVTNQAAITTRGGSVAAGAITTPATGGFGGDVYLYGDEDPTVTNPAAERVTNSGSIDTSGGDSLALTADPGPNAGIIDLYTTNDVTNSGALTANGGSDAVDDNNLATGFGHGGAPFFYLEAIDANATNSGAINANGGDGEAQGGAGASFVWLGDVQVVNSANISARGGDADAALAGSIGGDGGDIEMDDVDAPDNTGTLDVSGGAGDTPGADGTTTP